MPRFPVVAVSATRIYLFSGPVPGQEAFAVLPREQVRVIHGGKPCGGGLTSLLLTMVCHARTR